MGRKVKIDSRTYHSRMIDVMMMHSPQIYQCVHCGNPVADGYCCGYCDSAAPYDINDKTKNL